MAEDIRNRERLDPNAIKSVDEEIAEMVALIREARERLSEVEEEVDPVVARAKQRLEMLLEYRGESWSDGTGYARLASEGTRVVYDAEALDNLIIEDPAKYGWLKQYRKEISVTGGVRVK
ncbi:MAG TPA: hypothetical protein PK801_13195 [Aggregatilineales bacterium]|nr:hypothetical protein [Aggregatilineales bacterium]HPV08993.1 hypothetical protein [Aggregatilineales bacterium]HQA69277.1 hypothetical protein [Aggregatilineales bacterium]HQE17754.1 hypothetical protein [Aggregatilineales bacterium]